MKGLVFEFKTQENNVSFKKNTPWISVLVKLVDGIPPNRAVIFFFFFIFYFYFFMVDKQQQILLEKGLWSSFFYAGLPIELIDVVASFSVLRKSACIQGKVS